jgi:hypothetical protein
MVNSFLRPVIPNGRSWPHCEPRHAQSPCSRVYCIKSQYTKNSRCTRHQSLTCYSAVPFISIGGFQVIEHECIAQSCNCDCSTNSIRYFSMVDLLPVPLVTQHSGSYLVFPGAVCLARRLPRMVRLVLGVCSSLRQNFVSARRAICHARHRRVLSHDRTLIRLARNERLEQHPGDLDSAKS